jgi:hypothetical protein
MEELRLLMDGGTEHVRDLFYYSKYIRETCWDGEG